MIAYADVSTVLNITSQEQRDKRLVITAKIENNISKTTVASFSKIFILKEPNRVVMDLDAKTAIKLQYKLPSYVKIRHAQNPVFYRVVLDFDKDDLLSIKQINNFTAQITLSGRKILQPVVTKTPAAIPIASIKTASATAHSVPIDKLPKGKPIFTIAIDPGHGGKDPGTIGSLGVPEKTITLLYAKTLKDKLLKHGFNVIMTRTMDVFMPLEKRVEVARKHKADLFISIHADNAPSAKAMGMTIYTMSDLKQQDDNWRGFYKKEYIPADFAQHADKGILDTLIQMSQQSTKSKTTSLVDKMINYFKSKNLCTRCSHKSKSLAVLRGVDLQSMLIEVGYLSNFNDELKIISATYIEKVTNEIAHFLHNHFYQE